MAAAAEPSALDMGEDIQKWRDWYMAQFEDPLPESKSSIYVVDWITGLRDRIRAKLNEKDGKELAYKMLTRLAHTFYATSIARDHIPGLNRRTVLNWILPLYEVLIEIPQDSQNSPSGPVPKLSSSQKEVQRMAICFQAETKVLCSYEIMKIGYAIDVIGGEKFRSAFNNMLDKCLPNLPKRTPEHVEKWLHLESCEVSDSEVATKMVLGEFELLWESLTKLENVSDSGKTVESIINDNPIFSTIEYKHYIQSPGGGAEPATGNGNTRGDAFRRIRNSIAHTQYYELIMI